MNSRDDDFDLNDFETRPSLDWSQVKPVVDESPHWSEKFLYDQYDWENFAPSYGVLPLNRGYFCLVDEKWLSYLRCTKWTIHFQRYSDGVISSVYAVRKIRLAGKREYQYLHRVIAELENQPPGKVDHMNHWGLDNRSSNLKAVDHRENMANASFKKRMKDGNQGLPRGVSPVYDIHGKVRGYRASIRTKVKRKYSEVHALAEEAGAWYRKEFEIQYGRPIGSHAATRNEPVFPPFKVTDLSLARGDPTMTEDEEIPF